MYMYVGCCELFLRRFRGGGAVKLPREVSDTRFRFSFEEDEGTVIAAYILVLVTIFDQLHDVQLLHDISCECILSL